MDRIRIQGGKPLIGTILIGGAKNAALPLLAASLLTSKTLRLTNLPNLADITTMVHLLAELGVQCEHGWKRIKWEACCQDDLSDGC